MDWACAGGAPEVFGALRTQAEDFIVDEQLESEPSGRGEYAWLRIEKRHTNTDWLARELARFAGIPPSDVGYAGLKDRHALTTQWFSLPLRGAEPDWSTLALPEVRIVQISRERRGLRRGALRGNRFELTVRDLRGDLPALEARLRRVEREGVPNYFGEQRFGRDGANLTAAAELFAGRLHERDRHKRGLYLSAARSLLFNAVLSRRVEEGSWRQPQEGEVLRLDGGNSLIPCARLTPAIVARIEQGALHVTGPLWGRGVALPEGAVRALEEAVLADYARWREGLEAHGLQQERRDLRLRPDDFSWRLDAASNTLELKFFLPAGAYATALVRELVRSTAG